MKTLKGDIKMRHEKEDTTKRHQHDTLKGH